MANVKRIALCLALLLYLDVPVWGAEQYVVHSFDHLQLSDQFFCEGATFADLDRDGDMDVIAGPYWYAGPDFTDRFEYYPAKPFDINGYSDNFFAFSYDINADAWPDILVVGFPGKEARWYENPQGKSGHWPKHLVHSAVDNESPTFVELTGDGRPELVFHTGGRWGYAEIPADPTQLWPFHAISPNRGYDAFNHGLGVGDLNSDGRADLLEKAGWWEQPSPSSSAVQWAFHAVPFADAGGAQMLVYDVDGDGDNDVVTSKAAHGYGLSWFENVPEGGGITFREHSIMGDRPEQNDYGVVFSQLHALTLADVDRDGIEDIVVGKRFWAHGGHDPGALEPAVLYWFQTLRDKNGFHFIPHRIDDNSGAGTQVVAGDVNGDDWPDIIVGNKKGTFVFVHHAEPADKLAWERAQPQLYKAMKQSTPPAPAAEPQDAKEPADGFAATGPDGRALNLDFETGDLTDWTSTGTAFDQLPVSGDTVHARRGDSTSGHQGEYWVGTYEAAGDGPRGTLTSAPFEVSHPFATFLVGGGSHQTTRIEIVDQDSQQVIFQAHGVDAEQMHPVSADLKTHVGKQIFVRLVDDASFGWGHINFDHFRFHDQQPDVPAYKPAPSTQDEYPYAGLAAQAAAEAMKVPNGFSVSVFASEPDIKQPIAMTLDDRGRVWVAEAYEYPRRAPEGQGRDRILVFEDTNGDGHFDKRTVFAEGLNLVSGLEVGFGGVWVGAAPYLMFIPNRNGDDVPDGKPEVLLDGWGYQDTHETLNSFTWGPDGWLYGCHGVFTHSRVGRPGTPDDERIPLNAGVWRYHPTRHVFEVFANGTSNPWGIDFDDHGQAVITACVIPHLYHVIPGGRYQRQAGAHFKPYTYDDIKTIADHLHYLGESPWSGNDRSDSAGGGHAHAGAMIYLGGAWPNRYRDQIFMNNIHGQRINVDTLWRRGSGLVGSHTPDFLLTQDRASQMLNFRYGPDGQVFVIDWYDMQACHDENASVHDRSNGRIYRINYGKPRFTPVDLRKLSDRELVELTLNDNDWYVRHARRLLQERAAAGSLDDQVEVRLVDIATTHPYETRRLRAAWALHAIGTLTPDATEKLLADRNEYVRGWAIQLALDTPQPNLAELLPRFVELAESDPSPVVRLYLAAALQRLPVEQRWMILEHLVQHSEDAGDHNLPLMLWYAAEPLAEVDSGRALTLALQSGKSMPVMREFMLRRLASLDSTTALASLVQALGDSSDADEQLIILRAVRRALQGQRQVQLPDGWQETYTKIAHSDNKEVLSQATALGVTFGDESAIGQMLHLVSSSQATTAAKRDALVALLAAKDPRLVPVLLNLLTDPDLRDIALSGLALYDDPHTPDAILAVYADLPLEAKRKALATLTSRASYGRTLLHAIADKKLPIADLPADLVRQLHNLHDEEIDTVLSDLWGTIRATAADKTKLIAKYRALITGPAVAQADPELGRAVFAKTCQQCHTLYGVGETIGPDLTGSNRSDPDYLLTNVVDPSALIPKEYQPSVIITTSGRVITGIVSAEDDKSVTIRTATDTSVIPQDEIDDRYLSDMSMMPEGQLTQFSEQEIVSLGAYLMGKAQVPMLATPENVDQLFDGRDLTGWRGDPQLWSVVDGEIVGHSPGLDHNTFLVSDLSARDFRLTFEVKLVNNAGNSGLQFRSRPLKGYEELQGYQADIGPEWWGKLYEENGRELLWDRPGEEHVIKGDWNEYEIRAEGSHIRTWINGQPCVDLEDPDGSQRGIFALQLHAGEPMEVRFRNVKLEVLDESMPSR